MQQRLNQQGFSAGDVDGIWGPNTSAALMRFQRRNGLQPTGKLDQRALAALGVMGTAAASAATPPPAIPSQAAAVPAPSEPPGTVAGGDMDRTLRTNATGTNPGGVNAGTNAAGGSGNQAVATTNANALQPARGANSFSTAEAGRRIAREGFQNVNGLHKDDGGIWRGTAMKDGQQVGVWLDYKGNVGQQQQ